MGFCLTSLVVAAAIAAPPAVDVRHSGLAAVDRLVRGGQSTISPAQRQRADDDWAYLKAYEHRSVQVWKTDNTKVDGRLTSAGPDAVTIATGQVDVLVARDVVAKVRVRSLAKQFGIGALTMVAGGLAVFFTCPQCANEGAKRGGAIAGGVALGAILLVVPQYSTVYRAPATSRQP